MRALTKDDFLEVLREFKPTNHLAYEFDGESAEGEDAEEAGDRPRVGRVAPGLDLRGWQVPSCTMGSLNTMRKTGPTGRTARTGQMGRTDPDIEEAIWGTETLVAASRREE